MKIKDFMITDIISITKDKTIKQLLETLVTNKIGGVPVVDEENRLIGMISDGDVIRCIQPKGRTVYDMFTIVLVSEEEDLRDKIEYNINNKVDTIMNKRHTHTVHPNDNLEEALTILSKYHFKKIPVVDEDSKVVGVISRGDIIRSISTKIISPINKEKS
ncbi:CBS domain-containing protein [Virgibacillus subterraneus]|uniref:CBS domain-containing protein n=2 Tax=Virgibacillus TaxID=84406 RepID=A0A1H1C072_9BACI|nr:MULTISPECIES: CBS domain-containing protein [Virgibacillus]SDQ57613.1 CBS domain-containing protein [Virgibacillus salinus]SEQ54506.1 CBS domain-containing protein [Virgibacillus subterraneus]